MDGKPQKATSSQSCSPPPAHPLMGRQGSRRYISTFPCLLPTSEVTPLPNTGTPKRQSSAATPRETLRKQSSHVFSLSRVLFQPFYIKRYTKITAFFLENNQKRINQEEKND